MSIASGARPVIERSDVDSARVVEVITGTAERQRVVATAAVERWRSAPWPDGLVSLNCFTSTDGNAVLIYEQWSSDEELDEALRAPDGGWRGEPDWGVAGVEATDPQRYRLYRVVRGGAITDPEPVAECFPAAIFPMADRAAAEAWVDGLLSMEEDNEGEDRDYPGALAANFHISADGTSVFLLSEWASEQEAVEHIAEVIEPILAEMDTGGAGAGTRYAHHATLSGPGR